MKIKRELKFATFEYDDADKTIMIETKNKSARTTEDGEEVFDINGRIELDKVNTFALLRFMIRIAQRNWFRKWLKPENSES